MRFASALLTLLLTAPAVARPKAAVLPFTGKGGKELRSQVSAMLCDAVTCTPPARVARGAKPDWKKARQEKVGFLVTGKAVRYKGRDALLLSLLSKPGKPAWAKMLPVRSGKVPEQPLAAAADELLAAMGAGAEDAPAQAPEPSTELPPPPRATPREEEAPPVASAEPSDTEAPERERPSRSEARAEENEEAPSDKPSAPSAASHAERLVLDAGLDIFSRRLSYNEVQSSNLRSYQAGFILAPHLGLEVYPLAFVTEGLLSGLGLEVGYLTAVGLKSRRSEGPAHPTSLTRLDLALKMKIRPVSGSRAAVVPTVGYRRASFAVGAAEGSEDESISGLPGINYSALLLGLGGEVPFGDRVVAHGRFAYLPVLSSGEIISAAYFPNGSASGIEVLLGVGVNVGSGFQVRLSGYLTRYALSFTSETGDPYVAKGATDQYLGLNVGLRYTL